MLRALLWLISNPHKLKNKQVCLVTDCQSAVAALNATKSINHFITRQHNTVDAGFHMHV
jgi:hypothetical protein